MKISKEMKYISRNGTTTRNRLTQCMPAILLSTYQSNKNYIFQITDENGKTVSHYNNHNENTLEEMIRVLLNEHELKQDKNQLSSIPASTF